MSQYIQQLDDKVISQIAAGEVIEGPAAVVKELVENSLDAGALSITVAVETGGKSLVRVTDDGLGMSPEDLRLSVRRHTTSKIRCADDLQEIATLGFRGEALASIASVARLNIHTRRHEDVEGYKIVIEGAKEKDFAPAGCSEGSSVEVRDLFFNTPARKKFLKSDKSEAGKCFSVFKGLALAKPNVEWKYFQDDRLKVHLPRTVLLSRIGDLLGKQRLEGLEEVEFSETEYKITGYVSDKAHTRRSREHQFLYLNGRRITDRKLAFFIVSAYDGMIGSGEFPAHFLFLELDPHLVDVNVHPSKTEVRFQREYEVFSFVKRAVKRALGVESVLHFPVDRGSFRGGYTHIPGRQVSMTNEEYGRLFEKPQSPPPTNIRPLFPADRTVPSAEAAEKHTIPHVLFQLHNKYIVTQIKSGLALIDQHAAHERILFEQALNRLTSGKASSQGLLLPRQFDLAHGEEDTFEEILPYLLKMGFQIKLFGPRTYLVEAVPSGVKISDEVVLLRNMLDFYRETQEKWIDAAEKTSAAFACKAAVKTGDELSSEEMITLIEALFRTGTPYICPHGRPTYIRIETTELDRRFGRS